MKLLVTGGAGFIGSNFVNYCDQIGKEVCGVIDKLTYAADASRIPGHIQLLRQDIATTNLSFILEQTNPDVLVNFAAESHVDNSIAAVDEFIHSNYIGVHNILRHLRWYNKRYKKDIMLVQISTDEVWGDLPQDSTTAFNESDAIHPNNPYSATKAAADLLIQAFHRTYKDFPSIICRASNNFGPNQHFEKLLPTVITRAYNNEPIPVYGDGSNVREWLYVDDFSRGILAAIENVPPTAEVIGFGSNNTYSNIDTVKAVLKLMNKPESLISFVKDRKGHDRKYSVDYTKAITLAGWVPEMEFEAGLRIVIEDVLRRLQNFS